jgi:hypothetical protein
MLYIAIFMVLVAAIVLFAVLYRGGAFDLERKLDSIRPLP